MNRASSLAEASEKQFAVDVHKLIGQFEAILAATGVHTPTGPSPSASPRASHRDSIRDSPRNSPRDTLRPTQQPMRPMPALDPAPAQSEGWMGGWVASVLRCSGSAAHGRPPPAVSAP
jgi:hypothetical protein